MKSSLWEYFCDEILLFLSQCFSGYNFIKYPVDLHHNNLKIVQSLCYLTQLNISVLNISVQPLVQNCVEFLWHILPVQSQGHVCIQGTP